MNINPSQPLKKVGWGKEVIDVYYFRIGTYIKVVVFSIQESSNPQYFYIQSCFG